MSSNDIPSLLLKQRAFFTSGATRDTDFRLGQLDRLLRAVKENEDKLLKALASDLRKPAVESFVSELGFVSEEIRFALKHLKRWVKPKRVGTPLLLAISSSHIYYEPLGVTLIIGPWNYPFQLLIAPLVGAIAAGNCAVVKPSELAPATSAAVREIIGSAFNPAYIAVAEGGVETTQSLLKEKFDHIFFTGGGAVGRVVLEAAAKHLTPVTLELGGKSPVIIDSDTDLDLTARRIAWGKFFNAGQTCVAPDYCLVMKEQKATLLEKIRSYTRDFFGENPAESPDYARIINDRHFQRLSQLLGQGKNFIGGQSDPGTRYIAPTVQTDISPNDKIMEDEIFGPILPVLEVKDLDEAISFVKDRAKPLALYFFSKNRSHQRKVLREISFGGGCINDTLVHLSNPNMPFGGVGDSGMGFYHGRFSFETFSHRKSVVHKSFLIDPSLRYAPYKNRLGLMKRLMG